tara:strand:+ start:23416 stop:23874 length:459 start_codon:yes stop_codon:yes gene_type:complete
MTVILFLFVLVLFLFSIFLILNADEGVLGAGLIIFAVTSIFGFIIPYVSLNSDVQKVAHETQYLEIEKEYLKSLNAKFNDLPEFDSALLNGDTPVASLVQNIHEAENNIRERRIEILDAKRSIEARKTGMTAYIFWFYNGDEVLEELEGNNP